MSQHTPGPWKIVYGGSGEGCKPAIIQADRLQILVDRRQDFGNPLPDARLIAKAPEMLELVRRLAYGSNRPFDHPDARAMHKAGIAALALLREVEGEK